MGKVLTEWQGFNSTGQVSRLARVPVSTLYYWKAKGIHVPSVVAKTHDLEVDYGYSYANLTVIRLMRAIRDKKLNLPSVSISLHHLFERFGPPSKGWADAQVFIVGGHVFAEKRVLDDWGTTTAEKYGQQVETRLFGDLFDDLSPNPPKDTEGRREDSGRVGEGAIGEMAGLHWGRLEVGGRSSVAA